MKRADEINGERLSRRAFIVRAGAATCGVAFGLSACGLGNKRKAALKDGQAMPLTANNWVTLHEDGHIDIISPGIELGQGILSTLPRFVAEELDADWALVRCVPAPVNESQYGNPLFWNFQITAGSRTCMGYADVLRVAGAQARHVLILAAAKRWNVPVDGIRTSAGTIVHPDGKTPLRYGELVAEAKVPASFPAFVDREHRPQLPDDYYGEAPPSPVRPDPKIPHAVPLKSRKDFRLLGVKAPRQEIPSKVNGSALYGIDVTLPDLAYAQVETGPRPGCKPRAFHPEKARTVPGVIAVIPLPHGVAVVGSSMQSVQKGRAMLSVDWEVPPAISRFDSAQSLQHLATVAADPAPLRAVRVFQRGEEAATRKALNSGRRMSFDARSEFVYHATLEPQNATLRLGSDGQSAEGWVSTQWPTAERDAVAGILGLKPESVIIHTPFVGGAFGRRQEPGAIVDAALIVKELRRPVKVIWSREDDLRRNPHRQSLACHVEATVGKDGRIDAMHHRVAGDSWFARSFPDFFKQYDNSDPGNWTGALHAYSVPLQTVDCVTERGPIDVCYLRGIGVTQVKFAQESLIDKIARNIHADVIDYRRGLLKDVPRALDVIDATAAMAAWNRPRPAGRAIGFAYIPYGNSHSALAAEVSLAPATGQLRVHRVWTAIDAGLAVQPDIIASQMEGGIQMGMSMALMEAVTFRNGVPQQSNFHDYPMLRMADTPEIEVKVLSTDNPITGVGEIGMMAIAPAINSAIAALTGAHVTRMPMNAEQILHDVQHRT